jgi:hypothetical protein
MTVTLKFPETQSPIEILEFITILTKQYCLESEWKELESMFNEFYHLEQVKYQLVHMYLTSYECALVIKLLNNIYMNSHRGGESIAREIAIKIADRCSCTSSYTFQ